MVELPVGNPVFHRNAFIDYQLQRIWSEGFARLDDLHAAASQIESQSDFVEVFAQLADAAEAKARLRNAAFYMRAAEFFTPATSEAKRRRYERFLDLFDRGFESLGIERHRVVYGASHLPALRLEGRNGHRGAVLFFGGFDSLIEEFVGIWSRVASAGFDVIAFEGPGQGGARALFGHTFDHDWEKPVAAVLDHFDLRDVALVGMSMGGYWALRAAALEPRVSRVVAWPPVYDWLAQLPRPLRPVVRWLVRRRSFMRLSIRLRMRLFPILRHVVAQTLYITGSDDIADVGDWFLGMNADHIGSENVRQHVLLMVGERDTFQPPRLATAQANALVNAASVSTRVFTEAESAAKHCQMGNLGLATDHLASWLSDGL